MLFCRKGGFRFFSYYSTSDDSNDCVQEQAQKSWKEPTKHTAKQVLIAPVLVQPVCLPVSEISARKPEKYATTSDVSKYTTTSHDYTAESSSPNRSKSSKSSRFLQSSTSYYGGDSTERKSSKSDHRMSSDETSARSKAPLTSEDQRSSHASSTSDKRMSSASSTSTKYKSHHSSVTRRSASSMLSKSDIKMSSMSSSGLTSHMSSEARPRSKLIYKSSWNPSLSFETPTRPTPNRAPPQEIKQSSVTYQGSNLPPQEITAQPWRRRKSGYQSRKQSHSLAQRPHEQTKAIPRSEQYTPHIEQKPSASWYSKKNYWQQKGSNMTQRKKKPYLAQSQKEPIRYKGPPTYPKTETSRPQRSVHKQYSSYPPHESNMGRIPINDSGRRTPDAPRKFPTKIHSQEIHTSSQPTSETLPERPAMNFSQITVKQPVTSHSEITSEEVLNRLLETPSSQSAIFVEVLPKSKGMTPDSLSELLIEVPPDSTDYSVFASEFSSEPLSEEPIKPLDRESTKHNKELDTITMKSKKCEVPTKQPYRSQSNPDSKPLATPLPEACSPINPPSNPPSKPSFLPPLNLLSKLCRRPLSKNYSKPSPTRCPKPPPTRCSKPPINPCPKPPINPCPKPPPNPCVKPPPNPCVKPPPNPCPKPPPTCLKPPSTTQIEPPSPPPPKPPPPPPKPPSTPPPKPPPPPPPKPPSTPPPKPPPPPPPKPPSTPPPKPPPDPPPKPPLDPPAKQFTNPPPTPPAKPPPTPPAKPPSTPPPKSPSNPPPKPPSNPPPKPPPPPSLNPPSQPPPPPTPPPPTPPLYQPPKTISYSPPNPPSKPHSYPPKNSHPQRPEEPPTPKRSGFPHHEKCPPCPPYQTRLPEPSIQSCPPCPPCPPCPSCPPCQPCPTCPICPSCPSYPPQPTSDTKPPSPKPSLKREDTKDSCMSEFKDFCKKLNLLDCFREKFKSEKMRECIRKQLINSDGDRKLFQCEDFGESPCRKAAHRHCMKQMEMMNDHSSHHYSHYDHINLGCRPNSVRCPGCHSIVVTSVDYVVGLRTHLCALCLYLCGCCPCAILPYMINFFKVPQHFCTQCGTLVGVQEVNFPF